MVTIEGQKYSLKIGFGLNMLELESLYLKKTDLSPCIIPTIDSLHAFFKNYFPKEDIGPFPALYGEYFRNCILPFAGISFFSEKFIFLYVYVECLHGVKTFPAMGSWRMKVLKLLFSSSTDLFGRITVYKLDVLGCWTYLYSCLLWSITEQTKGNMESIFLYYKLIKGIGDVVYVSILH